LTLLFRDCQTDLFYFQIIPIAEKQKNQPLFKWLACIHSLIHSPLVTRLSCLGTCGFAHQVTPILPLQKSNLSETEENGKVIDKLRRLQGSGLILLGWPPPFSDF
jgi:hypothetical protein